MIGKVGLTNFAQAREKYCEVNDMDKRYNEHKKILSVWLLVADGLEIFYQVGRDNVDKIEEATKNGEMAEITYYKIYRKGNHFADVHRFDEVVYQED